MTIGMAMPSQYKLGFFLRMTGGPWEPVVSQPAVLVGWLWAVLITLLAFAHPIFARSEMITVSVLGIAWWLIAGFVLATGGY